VISLPEPVFDDRGLVPVVVQDRTSGDVLMVAFANREALRLTAETGQAHFWSRSRNALWRKGETSGHVLKVVEVRADCDADTVLMVVEPEGPTCHTGMRTCFGEASPTEAGVLFELGRLVAARDRERPEGSYVAKLLGQGLDATLKKVGEEATEVILAAKGESDERLAEESADLLFHLMVVLAQRGLPMRARHLVHDRRRRREMARQHRDPLLCALDRPLRVGHRPPGQGPEADFRMHLPDHGAACPRLPQVVVDVEDPGRDVEGLLEETAAGLAVVLVRSGAVGGESERGPARRRKHRRGAWSEPPARFQVASPLVALGVPQADRDVHEHERGRMPPRDFSDGGRDEVGMSARFVEGDGDPARAAPVHPDEIHGLEV
jgi:phosphoribosyl-ATP pyrophosphohydrolase/phosphoribosyl-AMP cyclohydrolase